jgi:hypothetical protein
MAAGGSSLLETKISLCPWCNVSLQDPSKEMILMDCCEVMKHHNCVNGLLLPLCPHTFRAFDTSLLSRPIFDPNVRIAFRTFVLFRFRYFLGAELVGVCRCYNKEIQHPDHCLVWAGKSAKAERRSSMRFGVEWLGIRKFGREERTSGRTTGSYRGAHATISGLIVDQEREKLDVSRLQLDLWRYASWLHDQSINQYDRHIQYPPRGPEYRMKYLKASTAVEHYRTASRRHEQQSNPKDAAILWLESQVAELKLSVEEARFDTGELSYSFLISLFC